MCRCLTEAVRRQGTRAMSLLDLKTARYPWETINRLPEPSRNLEHHDLLVDVLREEFEDTLQELRDLATAPNLLSR